MKITKFRAFDKAKKEWLLGYKEVGGFDLFGEIMLMGEWTNILDQYIFERNGHKQDDLVVMQFTGLLDKNGKEIYEGDILQRDDDIGVVKWNVDCACFDIKFPNIETLDMWDFLEPKVIGNIYENPELLK